MDKKNITMTIEETLEEGKSEFDIVIKMMFMFLNLGEITNENKSLSVKVNYKQQIVFGAMDKITGGNWDIPLNWTLLTDKQKNYELTNTIILLTPKE